MEVKYFSTQNVICIIIYNIIPKLFGRDNITFSARDTDSIIYKIKNCSHKKYFSEELGLIENEIKENINEVISLMSKCYSIETVDNKIENKSKGISKNYFINIILMNILKKYCLMKLIIIKQNFIEYL